MTNSLINKILDKLSTESTDLTAKELENFSDLDKSQVTAFLKKWKSLELPVKIKLLNELHQLFLDNSLVSFDAVGIALITNEAAEVRALALRLIEETKEASIAPSLLVLMSDPDDLVRVAAAKVLGNFIDLYELDEIHLPSIGEVEDALFKAFRDGKGKAAKAALIAIGSSSRDEVADAIEQAFDKKDSAWHVAAIKAAGRSADDRWAGNVVQFIDDPDHEVNLAAIETAGVLGLKLARQPLLDLINDVEDPEVLEAIIWALSSIGGEDVRVYLETMLAEVEDPDMIEFIEDAILNLSFTEDLEQFDLLAVDPDDEEDIK